MKSSSGVHGAGNEANTSERLFLDNPTMAEAAKRPDSLRGVYIRHSTIWSETMLLALRILMSHQAVQKHGLRPSRIASVVPTKAGASFAVPSIMGLLRNNLSEVFALLPT